MLGLENCEADLVIRFLCMPAILNSINPNKEQSIGNGVDGRPIGRTKTLEIAPHAALPLAGKYLLSWQRRALRSFSAQSARLTTKASTCSRFASRRVLTPQ